MLEIFPLLLVFLLFILSVQAWNEWDYFTSWSHTSATDAANKQTQWEAIWVLSNYVGDATPPRPRRGHSLHIIKTDSRSDYNGDTYIVMFGGRDNDQKKTHIPKTYNVESVS